MSVGLQCICWVAGRNDKYESLFLVACRRLLTSPMLAFVDSGLNLWSARPTEMVCVCTAAELVELGLFAGVDDAVGLLLLRSKSSCAKHMDGRTTNVKEQTTDAEAQKGIRRVAEAMPEVLAFEKITVVFGYQGKA